MDLQPCAECAAQLSDMTSACPRCGAPQGKTVKTKLWLWIPLGLIVAFTAFVVTVGLSPEAQQEQDERLAIDQCHKSQIDPFVCEEMVSKYRRRHGINP